MFIIFFVCVILLFIVEAFILKTDYLWKYKIESDACRFTSKSIERDNDHYQLIKADDFYFYIDKKSDVVVRFETFLNNSESVSICVKKKSQDICHYFCAIDTVLNSTELYSELIDQLILLAQTSFYFLLTGKNRDDVVNFLNVNKGCTVWMRTIRRLLNGTSRDKVSSISIHNYNLPIADRIDINAMVKTAANGRLMINTKLDSVIDKLIKRYAIKRIEHYESLHKDCHYYEVVLSDDPFGRILVFYDIKKKKTTFTLLTLSHEEPVLKNRHIEIEHKANFQINILNNIEKLFLTQYPSEDLIKYFANSYMDVSNGLKKEHLTVLEMFDI